MTIQDFTPELIPGAKIKVIGAGGAGGKTLNRMVTEWLEGVEFVAVNTDAQDLASNLATKKINIGLNLTKGLGAGADPEIGRKAAEESIDDIKKMLSDTDMVFITAGMGGGTGTGCAPVIGEVAKQMGILTVAVVTEPFGFEGRKRLENAHVGIDKLRASVDTLIIIPNDKIFNIIDKKTTFKQAFNMIDRILFLGVQGISDLIIKPGDINIDFADINSVLKGSGTAMLGIGYGAGEKRAVEAARKAIENPLLPRDLQGAKNIIFAVTGGVDLTPIEVQEAAQVVEDILDDDVKMIWGMTFDDSYEDEIKVTIIATGFDVMEDSTYRSATRQKSRQLNAADSFVTRSVKAENTHTDNSSSRVEPKEDLDTPAFMRKKL
jgi:cell division protein FtsZ